MHVVIKGQASNSLYTLRELTQQARATAKLAGTRYVRHWVEVAEDAPGVRLRVEVKRPDGLGDVLACVL